MSRKREREKLDRRMQDLTDLEYRVKQLTAAEQMLRLIAERKAEIAAELARLDEPR